MHPMDLLRAALLVGLALAITAGPAQAAKKHRYQCYDRGLCLGMSMASVAARYRKRGFKRIQKLEPLICRFYRPAKQQARAYPCRILRKGFQQLFLVARQGKLVFAYISPGPKTPTMGTLQKRIGAPQRSLRSLEGLNLFWTYKRRGQPMGLNAFLPVVPRSAKEFAKARPKGFSLFHLEHLKGSPFQTNFAAILQIASHTRKHKRWPRRCFHTLCLGSSARAALSLLKVQGYQVAKNVPFRRCKPTFSSSKTPAKGLRCLVLHRPVSQTYLRMVWSNDALIFVQGERLSPTPKVQTLREVWGPETRKLWLRGMLFLQWFKKKGYRYILSVPLYGDKRTKKPLGRRRSVGFILLDWHKLNASKMGRSLKGFLKLP